MVTIDYDDSNLQRLWEALDSKQRMKALKGAFRREANRVRKIAIKNLRQSIRGDQELERGVRALVWKRKAGFRVTVGTKRANKKGKGAAGYYISRKRRKDPDAKGKPVLLWADLGTKKRYTKSKTKIFRRKRKGHFTGSMKPYKFMEKTANSVRDSVTGNLHKEIIDNIKRTAKRYGCT